MVKYKVMWETKDGRTIEDKNLFDSEEEAGTYIGIEMTQFETEEVKTYKIVSFNENHDIPNDLDRIYLTKYSLSLLNQGLPVIEDDKIVIVPSFDKEQVEQKEEPDKKLLEHIDNLKVEWFNITNMPISNRQLEVLKNSLKVHADLLVKAYPEVRNDSVKLYEVVRNHDACMTLLYVIDDYIIKNNINKKVVE